MSRLSVATFARMAATANTARRAPGATSTHQRIAAPPPMGTPAWFRSLAARVNQMREPTTNLNTLTDNERAELTILAFSALRDASQRERIRRPASFVYRPIDTPTRKARP